MSSVSKSSSFLFFSETFFRSSFVLAIGTAEFEKRYRKSVAKNKHAELIDREKDIERNNV